MAVVIVVTAGVCVNRFFVVVVDRDCAVDGDAVEVAMGFVVNVIWLKIGPIFNQVIKSNIHNHKLKRLSLLNYTLGP